MSGADEYHGLPTPRTTLAAGFLEVLVWCKGGCGHQAAVDLPALIEAGKGDVPLIHLRYRCSGCGTGNTDWVVTSRGAARRVKDAAERLVTAEASIEELEKRLAKLEGSR